MRRWTIAQHGAKRCQYCGRQLEVGSPVQQITFPGRNLAPQIRCPDHANAPINWDEVEQERWRIDEERRRASTPVTPHQVRRELRPLSEIAGRVFDPKAAAAGERDE